MVAWEGGVGVWLCPAVSAQGSGGQLGRPSDVGLGQGTGRGPASTRPYRSASFRSQNASRSSTRFSSPNRVGR